MDQDIGISADNLDQLFSVFYRASNVGALPGTGLGLAIVKQWVGLHNGTIDVKSEVDKGTDFKVAILTSLGM